MNNQESHSINTPGPNTEAGKEISSRNATKHGCCSIETLILPNENKADFEALESTWFRAYKPTDTAEVHLVHQLAEADWFLQRAIRTLAEVEARIYTAAPNPLEWVEDQHRAITRFQRYRTTHTNNVIKRQKAIEDYRKNRTSETHKDEKQTIVKAKFEMYRENNKPESQKRAELRERLDKANQERLNREPAGPRIPSRI